MIEPGMPRRNEAERGVPEGPNGPEWPERRDRIREAIRQEVDRVNPIDDSRRSVELIVETSVRWLDDEGTTRIAVESMTAAIPKSEPVDNEPTRLK